MRTMYDAVTASNIPVNAPMVAGYVDLWSEADWARFPNAVKVRIARLASVNDGDVLDVENTDATPDQAPGWVTMRRNATGGVQKTVYMSESAWQAVRDAFAAQGIAEPEYWVAAYPGIGADLYPGSVAHQYVDTGPYDLSVVADYWPGVDKAPDPPKEIEVSTGTVITVVRGSNRDDFYYVDYAGNVWHEWPGKDANNNPVTGKEQINKDNSGNVIEIVGTIDGYYLPNIGYTFIKGRTHDDKTFTAKQADDGSAWTVTVE